MNAISTEVAVAALAAMSADGKVYRAYHHLIAATHGELLLVPLGRSVGDLRGVIDACPVPWEEVLAVLDEPRTEAAPVAPDDLCRQHARLAQISPYGWARDAIRLPGATRAIPRLTHASGIVFARVAS